jgi:tetratricopeptide (TPR) repeat protein
MRWRDKAAVVAVAMDVQGADAARPYVRLANAQYATLVDTRNVLADVLGFKAVPNTFLVDEAGRFVRRATGREDVETWVQGGEPARAASAAAAPNRVSNAGRVRAVQELVAWIPDDGELRLHLADAHRAAGQPDAAEQAYREAIRRLPESSSAHFRYASLLLERSRKQEALRHLRRALELDPANYLIRKQIWAIENPDRFYAGEIDWAWQKKQSQ